MDWILDHLQIIIAIAGAIAYWLNARHKERAGEAADYDGDGKPDTHPQAGRSVRELADEAAQDENMRRIREEIRRKIAERQAGGGERPSPSNPPPLHPMPSTPPPLHAPSSQTVLTPAEQEARRRARAAAARREEAEREAAEALARQRGLAEQMAALQARKAAADRASREAWTTTPEPARAAAGGSRDDVDLIGELRNARSLRKAIVLREVLGAPVGLR